MKYFAYACGTPGDACGTQPDSKDYEKDAYSGDQQSGA